MNHLSDDLLNEYLDGALAPDLCIEAEAHLAACPHCATRFDALAILIADIAALTDMSLEVDFAPVIIAQLEHNALLPRTIRWLTTAQAFGALLAAILGWPLVESVIKPVSLPLLSNMVAQSTSSWLQTVIEFRIPIITFELPSLDLNLPSATLILAIAGVSLLWLAANGLLLIPRSRRTS